MREPRNETKLLTIGRKVVRAIPKWGVISAIALLAVFGGSMAAMASGSATQEPQGNSVNELPLANSGQPIPVTYAKKWLSIGSGQVEGPCIDRTNTYMYVTNNNIVVRITLATKATKTIYTGPSDEELNDCKIGKNGQLYLSDLGATGPGKIFTINPDGSGYKVLIDSYNGTDIHPDGIVFSKTGMLYWVDLNGNVANRIGRIFVTNANFTQTTEIMGGLAWPNGISLSPDGTELWVSEMLENRLLWIDLDPAGTGIASYSFGGGAGVAHYFSGYLGPDSNIVDSAGNIYQCIWGQGEVVVLNNTGVPIEDVVVPQHDQGYNLMDQNVVIVPGTKNGFIVGHGVNGTFIATFQALATALTPYSHE